jgi:hypothetical protein
MVQRVGRTSSSGSGILGLFPSCSFSEPFRLTPFSYNSLIREDFGHPVRYPLNKTQAFRQAKQSLLCSKVFRPFKLANLRSSDDLDSG